MLYPHKDPITVLRGGHQICRVKMNTIKVKW
jgi:hypothetical protein